MRGTGNRDPSARRLLRYFPKGRKWPSCYDGTGTCRPPRHDYIPVGSKEETRSVCLFCARITIEAIHLLNTCRCCHTGKSLKV